MVSMLIVLLFNVEDSKKGIERRRSLSQRSRASSRGQNTPDNSRDVIGSRKESGVELEKSSSPHTSGKEEDIVSSRSLKVI